MTNSSPPSGLELRISTCESTLSESESMGGIRDPGWRKPVLMICYKLVNMLRVIKSQKGEFDRPEMATKQVLQRESPMRKGQVLECTNTRRNPNQSPTKKPLALYPNQQLLVPRRPSHESPAPLRIHSRFLKKQSIGVGIISYAISVERMGIHPETVLIRSLWTNPRKRRLPRRSL